MGRLKLEIFKDLDLGYQVQSIDVDAVIVCYGAKSDVEWLGGEKCAAIDGGIYSTLALVPPGVFFAGDCRQGSPGRVVSAMGSGGHAVTDVNRHIAKLKEASK